MTVEEFLRAHNGAPYDTEKLVEIASDVEGPLGEAAEAWDEANTQLMAALDKIGFEWG